MLSLLLKVTKSQKRNFKPFSQIDLNHKTSKKHPWAYISQSAFLVCLYSGFGGYNLVPRVSCLSDIGLHFTSFLEVAIESWPQWDLNPRPLNSVQAL